MTRARAALFRHLQIFFETHLRGIHRYDEFAPYVAQDAEPEPGKRRWAHGKLKEIVEGRFGDYEILLASPLEVPPLGRVSLRAVDGGFNISGPIDSATFDRMGEAIRFHHRQRESV
jgi:hypothetical protein